MLGDPAEVTEALRKVGELGCTTAMPKLEELFATGSYREDVTRAVKFIIGKAESNIDRMKSDVKLAENEDAAQKMRERIAEKEQELKEANDRAIKLLLTALKTHATSVIAASIFEEWKTSAAEGALAEVIKSPQHIKARTAAIKALAAAQKDGRTHEDLYIWVTEQEPNAQSIEAFRVAVEELGKIKSAKGVPYILRTMFIRNQKNEEAYAVARLSVARIGPSVAGVIAKFLNGEDADFQAWAQRRGVPDWEWRYGPKLIQSLEDLRDPRAAAVVIENLASPIRPLQNVPPDVQERWRRNQVNRIKVCMFALAAMRNDEIVPKAKEVVLNPENDIQQRLDTASALAMMGTDAARTALVDIFAESPKEQFRAPLLIPLTLGLHFADKERFDKLAGRDKSELVKRALENPKVKAHLDTVDECKGERQCLMNMLTAEANMDKKAKAALLVSHLDPDHDALFKPALDAFMAAKAVQVDLKRYLLMALARNSVPADAEAIEMAFSSISRSRRLAYWAEALKMLREYVARKSG